jgi:hypothetical protein
MFENHMVQLWHDTMPTRTISRDEAHVQAEETICTIEYWEGRELSADDALRISECMALLDKACNGDELATLAILANLHRLQKSALLDETDNILEG